MSKTSKITCSVCIATYKRKLLLHNLLSSLLTQVLPSNIYLEIIVVDNDKDQSAKNIVSEFSQNKNASLLYFCQPIQNISLTRNIGINNSSGQFIAIIDDDETADKYWIYNLINTIINYDADAVFGFVEPIFPAKIPIWVKQRELYFNESQETGSIAKATYTTNCLFKSSLIKIYNIQFNHEYGLSGGEDTFFFETLRDKGAKFVNCKEAVSYEVITVERAKFRYILAKSFQGGNTYARNQIALYKSKFKFMRIKMLFRGVAGTVLFFMQAAILIYDRKKVVRNFVKISANLGKVFASLNIIYKHYKS